MSKLEVILCESLENSLAEAIEKCPHDRLLSLPTNIPTVFACHSCKIFLQYRMQLKSLSVQKMYTKSGNSGFRMASPKRTGSHPPFTVNKFGWRHGDRPRRFCRRHLQAWNSVYQYPHYPTFHGRRLSRRKNRHKLQWTENEIGVFAPASSVLLETEFLRSLDAHNFFSGYAEMLKHGLISTPEHLTELLSFDTEQIDYAALKAMVGRSVQVKENIVEQDPKEHGIRKALNLGHTIGHAFESLALAENRPVLHGYAVAWGIVCELYLSHIKTGFPKEKMRQTIQFIKENYGAFAFNCKQYDRLYELMLHDKKILPASSTLLCSKK